MEVLKSVDLIACEDTRHTKILLDHYAIKTPTTSFYQHNRITKADYLLGQLKQGKNIALVSDAGMPGILDPGYNIINAAIKNQIEITVIPGAAAFVNALVASGKPAHEFYFAGFLSNKTQSRRNQLKKLAELKCTIIFYESCHRIVAALQDVENIFPGKEIVIARELTKKFEEIKRDSCQNLIVYFQKNKPRGEFVVLI